MITTAALLDAMVELGLRRFVFGGSIHAVGHTPRVGQADGLLRVKTRLRPDTFCGVGKASAETLMSLYADHHGLDVVSRIGLFRLAPATVRHLATWLSRDDCVRMVVEAALTATAPGFAVMDGISNNSGPGGTPRRAGCWATSHVRRRRLRVTRLLSPALGRP